MAFHSVSTLSSRPGRIRSDLASKSQALARSTSGGRSRGEPGGRLSIERPSKLPLSETPYQSIAACGKVLGKNGSDLIGGPRVEQALHALGVGVLRSAQAGDTGSLQVTQHVSDRLLHHLDEPGIPGQLPRMQVGENKARLVVEHLLEVGDRPCVVGGVTGKAPAQMVVDATRRHRLERGDRDSERGGVLALAIVAQAELDQSGLREFRRRPEASLPGIVASLDLCDGLVHQLLRHLGPVPTRRPRALGGGARKQLVGEGRPPADRIRKLVGLLLDLLASLVPGLVDRSRGHGGSSASRASLCPGSMCPRRRAFRPV